MLQKEKKRNILNVFVVETLQFLDECSLCILNMKERIAKEKLDVNKKEVILY